MSTILTVSTRTSETITNALGATVRVEDIMSIAKNRVERYANRGGSQMPVEEIEEIFMDVVTKVIETLDRFDPSRGSLSSWISRIANNIEIDHFKSYMKHVSLEKDIQSTPHDMDNVYRSDFDNFRAPRCWEPDYDLESEESLALIEGACASLPSRRREAVRLTANGAGPKDVAESLDISESAAGTLVHNARTELRKKLGDEFENPSHRICG